ncbi:MAG: choline/glycine/proline betaine transport protein [Paraglaciecola sp.]|jgi:choline/glycine/proline betaine transport protein
MNPVTSTISMGLVILFLLAGVFLTEGSALFFDFISSWILAYLKWYYIGIVASFLFFCIWLACSRHGNLRLGDDDSRPEYSNFAWFAMLFSAGMGIGLIFWSIAEPITHFQSNPFVEQGLTPEAAHVAMRLTFFHWGLHPWAIYVVVGLSLSYFSYRKKLPLTIRSALYPLIGNKIYGPIGHTVDILAVFGTIFGVATSLGLGVTQMNTGLNTMFGMDISVGNQMLLILVISSIATLSVVSGVGRGVRILSEVNMWLTVGILVFLLCFGPTRFLLGSLVQNIGDYFSNLLSLSTWTDSYTDSKWQSSWTAFYWGWWMAWAPFVGMFIARVSKGRTIREFIIGVLLVPSFLGFIWLTLFGSTALYLELFHHITNDSAELVAAVGQAGVIEAVQADVTSALYVTIDKLDAGFFGTIAAFIVTLLIATFFITSSDSGTLVITTILSMGNESPPLAHRILWGFGEGAVAAILLLVGGLAALQTAAIIVALPFSLVMIIMMWGLIKSLRQESLADQGLIPEPGSIPMAVPAELENALANTELPSTELI